MDGLFGVVSFERIELLLCPGDGVAGLGATVTRVSLREAGLLLVDDRYCFWSLKTTRRGS